MADKGRISIRLDFRGKWVERLEVIREYLGLKTNTECIRFLIMEKYREIREKKTNER